MSEASDTGAVGSEAATETPQAPAQEAPTASEETPPETPAETPKPPDPAPEAAPKAADFAWRRREELRLRREHDRLTQEAQAVRAERERLAALAEESRLLEAGDLVGLVRKRGWDRERLLTQVGALADVLVEGKDLPSASSGNSEVAAVRRELEALKAERDKERKEAQQAAQLAEAQSKAARFHAQLNAKIADNPDKYELLAAKSAGPEVAQLLVAWSQQEGVPDELLFEYATDNMVRACDELEAYYEEDYKKTANAKKLQAFYADRFKPKAEPADAVKEPSPSGATPTKAAQPGPTLGNVHATKVPPRGPGKDPQTPEEYREHALAVLREQRRAAK